MAEFEKEMFDIVDNIQFKKVHDRFQHKLKKDVIKIKSSNKILVQADKSRNIYIMDNNEYSKLLSESITQKYKFAEGKTVDEIDEEFTSITRRLQLDERIDRTVNKQAFITLKDHKVNFENNKKCRLINPTKSEIGKSAN